VTLRSPHVSNHVLKALGPSSRVSASFGPEFLNAVKTHAAASFAKGGGGFASDSAGIPTWGNESNFVRPYLALIVASRSAYHTSGKVRDGSLRPIHSKR